MGSNPTADSNLSGKHREGIGRDFILSMEGSFVGLAVMTFALHAKGPRFDPGTKYILLSQIPGENAPAKNYAPCEDRTHDLRIMRPTRYQLR